MKLPAPFFGVSMSVDGPQVPTKITKGQIEITTEVFLVPQGNKVRHFEAMP